MGEDELGTVILSSQDIHSSSIMPEIPIRPNTSIPKTIGVLMILGSLLVIFEGGGSILTHFTELTTSGAEDQVELMKLIGVDVTVDEFIQWDAEFKESNFHLITGAIKLCAGILILVGGIQLFLRKYIGIKISLSGGSLWFLTQVTSIFWASAIESKIDISLATQWDVAVTAMCFICNAFCILLPLIPMLAPAGKAALLPIQNTKKDNFVEEE